jgi:hypothetical protein
MQVCSSTTSNASRISFGGSNKLPITKRSARWGYFARASATPVGAMSSPVASSPYSTASATSCPRPQPGTSVLPRTV